MLITHGRYMRIWKFSFPSHKSYRRSVSKDLYFVDAISSRAANLGVATFCPAALFGGEGHQSAHSPNPIDLLPSTARPHFTARYIHLTNGRNRWVCFAGGYSVGAAYAYKLQGKWLLGIDGSRASLAGEWVTLTAMMTLFLMNFAGGTVQATNPELFASVGFTVVYAVSIALASGSFLGRAYKVMRSK